MQDFEQIVREQLRRNRLNVADPDAIVAELAAHLEETYETARLRGLDDAAAIVRTLQEVGGWRALAREIRRTRSEEEDMNSRTKSLWLPAMVNLLTASVLLALMQWVGARPRFIWIHAPGQPFALMFYVPWLLLLPLFGAGGAYLARRAHGETLTRLVAALSPALAFVGVMCLALPVDLALGGFSSWKMVVIAYWFLTWGVLPAIALLAGALPFLREGQLAKT